MKSSWSHQLGDAYRKAVSVFTAVETTSQFEAKGTLTVAEFLEAGDALVFKFPTWQWAPASEKKLQKDYLPADKQLLVTRHVPCEQRVADLDRLAVLATEGSDDCWFVGDEPIPNHPPSAKSAPVLKVVDEYSRLDQELGGEQEDVVVRRVEQDERELRNYDLSITWDKFYQTPRLWLRGYRGSGEALSEKEVKEDVLSAYASKTVTMEIHPGTGEVTASIHPCKHAEMMKRVINTWKEKNIPIRSDLCLFVFLKFISGVVPTINYDFTFDLEMNQ